MKCENRFCIYQAKGNCVLEEVGINSLGMCTECIYPAIDEKILEEAKVNCLRKCEKKENVSCEKNHLAGSF